MMRNFCAIPKFAENEQLHPTRRSQKNIVTVLLVMCVVGYAHLLHVVGCLVNEVRSLKDYKVTACADRGVLSDKQLLRELNRDVNSQNGTECKREGKVQMFYNIKKV